MKAFAWLLAAVTACSVLAQSDSPNLVEILRRYQAELDAREGRGSAAVQPAPLPAIQTPAPTPAIQTPAPTAIEPPPEAEKVKPPPRPEELRLLPGDRIDVAVEAEPEMSLRNGEVGVDGTIRLPIVGPVPVAGKTLVEASRHIRQILERDYLVNPAVRITRATGEPEPEVAEVQPQEAPPANAELTEASPAITEFPPTSPAATAPVEAPSPAAAVPSEETSTAAAATAPSVFIQIAHEVINPGRHPWPEEGLTLRAAIDLAGGTTARADLSRVKVRRLISGEWRELEVNLEETDEARRGGLLLLKPGDQVEVPAKR